MAKKKYCVNIVPVIYLELFDFDDINYKASNKPAFLTDWLWEPIMCIYYKHHINFAFIILELIPYLFGNFENCSIAFELIMAFKIRLIWFTRTVYAIWIYELKARESELCSCVASCFLFRFFAILFIIWNIIIVLFCFTLFILSVHHLSM